MIITYEDFVGTFLEKVSEFDLMELEQESRTRLVSGYMKRAMVGFMHVCKYDLLGAIGENDGEFEIDIPTAEAYEILDIVSDGMVVQWLKPFINRQELLENVLNTRDFQQYSPSELLLRVGGAYEAAKNSYTQSIREYSYNYANLGGLNS